MRENGGASKSFRAKRFSSSQGGSQHLESWQQLEAAVDSRAESGQHVGLGQYEGKLSGR
jgi:hypothetical protein